MLMKATIGLPFCFFVIHSARLLSSEKLVLVMLYEIYHLKLKHSSKSPLSLIFSLPQNSANIKTQQKEEK